jgi:hypothetical protein
MTPTRKSAASVVKVGGGRGFIIAHRVKVPPLKLRTKNRPKEISFVGRRFVEHRLIVTAAHCLPNMPRVPPVYSQRTYKKLLGTLDGNKNEVWAVCLFANPVGDIAILGCPDDQDFCDEADAYRALVDEAPAMQIGKARSGRGWVLNLSGDRWVETTLKIHSSIWGPILETGPTESGMSGSPILNDAGRAVGIVSQGHETVENDTRKNVNSGPEPILALELPGWLLQNVQSRF